MKQSHFILLVFSTCLALTAIGQVAARTSARAQLNKNHDIVKALKAVSSDKTAAAKDLVNINQADIKTLVKKVKG